MEVIPFQFGQLVGEQGFVNRKALDQVDFEQALRQSQPE